MMHKRDVIDPACPLYDSRWEHDACGTGFLAHISGEASHSIVQTALDALARLTHRGAQDADAETNDGAGILTQIPRELLVEELASQGVTLADPADLVVGMLFLPASKRSPDAHATSRRIIEQTLAETGLVFLGWRNPPIDYAVLGSRARETAPDIVQILLSRPAQLDLAHYDRALYAARRLIEGRLAEASIRDSYIVSLSRSVLIYKGLLAPDELARFYLDLANPRYTSALAIFHQRYSTNTLPAWPLAQPMRMLAHNGEINTIQGNRNWMQARESAFASPLWGEKIQDLLPVVQEGGSDSAQLDNALELLAYSGRDLLHSMQMLIPPAWEQKLDLDEAQRAWCEYHAELIEPWDGPAALVFSDGRIVGAALDRNGLRPARYMLTAQGLFILASEAGVIPCDPGDVVEKGRLGPGEMIAVDVERRALLRDGDIKAALAQRQPYGQWLAEHLRHFADLEQEAVESEAIVENEVLFARQQLFGYTHEDVEMVLRPILQENKEPVWSMGDDTPLAVLSSRERSFSDYFRQRFAQVTNPPIDPLRERIVMSLDCYLGSRESLLTESPLHAHLMHLESPLLTERQLKALAELEDERFRSRKLATMFEIAQGPAALEVALERLEQEAIRAINDGISLLILSDTQSTPAQAPLPMVLAVGAVHNELIRRGLRSRVSLICETGTVCDVHQIAVLLGYGAEALVPTLALASVRALAGERRLEHVTPEQAVASYLHAVEDGLCKVMARMGISTLRNIVGAGQFEIVGLDAQFVQRCFAGSAYRPGKVSYTHIAEQIIQRCTEHLKQPPVAEGAAARRRKLNDLGRYRFRRDAEYHAYNPFIVRALQKAARSGNKEDYRQFTALIYSRPSTALHDLLTFKPTTPIPLEEVEPMEAIRTRFIVSAMSLGALSPETYRTIAAAMNSIGARNNSGEGGEDPHWYHETINGFPIGSKIKQIASARFGVTTEYLVRAEEIEIKMAQGSKPGEGGQLPPSKVTPFIARLRHTAPGVPLISPPPHHDIYSIEDIAQLIYDLHQVNPGARVGVKLVSSIGVGTIAAGVAKGHADYVLISGHDGGTGASPLQSIKHAGMPWELGLAEAQQVLVRNGLRKRVKVRVDGGFKTGRDVIVGAMLGAEEFAFGTAALVSLGCDMARQCHLNTCPAGIATQREDLRAKFEGLPQHLINYLTLVAEEVREWLAQLGVRSLDELVGCADMLQRPEDCELDLEALLAPVPAKSERVGENKLPQSAVAVRLLEEAEQALTGERSVVTQHTIQNYDRAIGVGLAGEIARRYGNVGLPGVSITCNFQGSAGQSFGAFSVPGMRLLLSGEANDYVGKGMTGGQIVIAPPAESHFASQENTIVGNTVLYGATGGQLFAAGRAGERFAVRNSGALAVVEGVGAHACEYMTGGMVVVLGETGPNFGAGMSSGVAYVLDWHDTFIARCNPELVELLRLNDPRELEALRVVVGWHAHRTHSRYAARILDEWERVQGMFWRVLPRNTSTSACDFVKASDYDFSLRGAEISS
ncbi:glutamate synthase large subunit [Ktedonosporobacter rubrisoli]|uniref:Glutamate synthase large subunit n=1 Tax=Ktedonosporobacter rubrisoli TaxID=2509675 RepID=A0A4P6JTX3_KTERU|nr:glutamate synthase large subunit [Ktedonosporobacter rubrisoli]QBD79048.1 glutamate synthase large subunit [Ktedonosporobacter rubrisoli]